MGVGANFANILRKKHNLSIPVDIESLIQEYAILKFKSFPKKTSHIDGVTLNLKKSDKVEVYININQPSTRIQFTLAHELGHIIIPWHTGNIIDNLYEESTEDPSSNYSICESEADDFASELLLPSEWINDLVKDISDIENLKLIIYSLEKTTKMSHSAIAYKVIQYLNPGFVFVVLNKNGYIEWFKSSISTNETLSHENKGQYLFNTSFYKRNKDAYFDIEVNGFKYLWFYTAKEIEIEFDENDTRTEKELIRDIVKDLELEPKFHIASISSALAFCRQNLQESRSLTFENLYRVCIEKVNREEKYRWITKHPLYKTYIFKRVNKLLS
ncbi:ImmA/IrrE family metallo-endopeptidase [Aliarcobacter butzleri]|uniref:ImmA/IrrE family metallo-endopeptidase n=1 Tax=Aliarcobacter butzleri TaxID=28197 RepID=UPI0021B29CFA|nr:ImmA/IrrE family metallo-endopeptidase [Aliarcobacter butzleri]MCT7649115.1 ImmA/IrrE family metallo-endopeptidase [Aliarcobacter butzleri]MDK2080370.1 ImmA/IrrE family metallo-endopeptidase [Aliarcobacter butzleri]